MNPNRRPCVLTTSRALRFFAAFFLAMGANVSSTAAPDEKPLTLLLQGRVVDQQTNKAVTDVTVQVHRFLANSNDQPFSDDEIKVDRLGRFKLIFPAEEVANARLHVVIRLLHPDYVPMESGEISLAMLDLRRSYGERPTLGTVPLTRRVDYTAKILTLDQQSGRGILSWIVCQDVPFRIVCEEYRDSELAFLPMPCEGRTDANGLAHGWMPPSESCMLWIESDRFVLSSTWWNFEEPPSLFGIFSKRQVSASFLRRGLGIQGRLLDLQGNPIPRRELGAVGSSSVRTTTTRDDGTFAFGPLDPDEYLVFAIGQFISGGDLKTSPLPLNSIMIAPEPVALKGLSTPSPIELREVPSVVVEIAEIDAQGRPFVGDAVMITGEIPDDPAKPRLPDLPNDVFHANARDLFDMDDPIARTWSAVAAPDDHGKIRVRVPRGLSNATFSTIENPFPDYCCLTRESPDKPFVPFAEGSLGTITENPKEITLQYIRSPHLIINLVSEAGPLPANFDIMVHPNNGIEWQGCQVQKKQAGQFVTIGLYPGKEYRVSSITPGFRSDEIKVTLEPNSTREITLHIRRAPSEGKENETEESEMGDPEETES